MTPIHCHVKDDPEKGTYGDCVRACVASILDLDADQVPHFYVDNDPHAAKQRMVDFLAGADMFPFFIMLPDTFTVGEVFDMVEESNAHAGHWLLMADNHCYVCYGSKVVHDPRWIPESPKGPCEGTDGSRYYGVVLICHA